MTRILRKNPLIEAVCEFHFDVPHWDWTIPGVVYGRIKDRFPDKAEATHVDFRVDETPEGVHPTAQARLGQMQFWGRDRQQLVQVGQEQLSIHQLKPYSGWPKFKVLIEQVLADYETEAPFKGIRRISLRYVNRLPIPDEPHKIEQLVRVMPQIPDSTDQLWASWFQQVEILQPNNKAALVLRSGNLPLQQAQPEEGEVTPLLSTRYMMLDLLFAHVGVQPIERENVSSWLETAHQEIEALFFKSLQPEYLKVFKPEDEDEN